MYNPVCKHFDEWTCLSFGKWCKILNVCTSLSGLTQITNANFEWFLWILHSCHFKFSAWALRRKYCLFREQMQECCHKCKYCDVCSQKEGGVEEIANQVLLVWFWSVCPICRKPSLPIWLISPPSIASNAIQRSHHRDAVSKLNPQKYSKLQFCSNSEAFITDPVIFSTAFICLIVTSVQRSENESRRLFNLFSE